MEFVAAVSHELRTPVAVIHSAAGNLADGVVGDPARVRRYGATIQTEARRLGETVERVLQLAGLGSGRPLPMAPLSAADVVHERGAATRPLDAERAGVDVHVEIGAELPPLVGDGPALQSAVQNLVGNAVKYARRRSLGARAGRRRAARRRGAKCTSPWTTTVPASTPTSSGRCSSRSSAAATPWPTRSRAAGSGLSLVRRIVDAHGGRVELRQRARPRQHLHHLPARRDRRRGTGRRTDLARRRRARAAALGVVAAWRPVAEGRLLLVEDEPGLQLTLSDRLVAEGYSVETAGDGELGLARATTEGVRPHRARRDAAQARRLRRVPHAAAARHRHADPDAHRPRPGGGPRRRAQARRRRLPDQAVRADRAAGAHRGAAAPRPGVHTGRCPPAASPGGAARYTFDEFVVDVRKAEVTRDGEPVDLSAKEFQLLRYFLEHRGATISRDELLHQVWGYQNTPSTRTVDVHVAWLRQKLEPNPKVPQIIVTVHGLGYKFAG